jgi:hypothetical protein
MESGKRIKNGHRCICGRWLTRAANWIRNIKFKNKLWKTGSRQETSNLEKAQAGTVLLAERILELENKCLEQINCAIICIDD